MNLKELNYIVTIADEGSISRAAEKLYMAQSSLSQSSSSTRQSWERLYLCGPHGVSVLRPPARYF